MHPELEQAFDLGGRVAVVTGAARGIGRQAAVTFAQAGADVVIADVLEADLKETADAVAAIGRTATIAPTDVTDKASVDALAETAGTAHGRIDIWANVAGILRHNLIVDTPEAELDAVLAVNVKGVYFGCQAAARAMIPNGRGSIINIASTGMDRPHATISCYALSKAAVAMLTRTLAVELGPHGIRANSVAPGFVPTPMTAVHWTNPDGTIDEAKRSAHIAGTASVSPMGTTGEPVDMAWAMLYLASDAARFVTGQVLRPNGGISMP